MPKIFKKNKNFHIEFHISKEEWRETGRTVLQYEKSKIQLLRRKMVLTQLFTYSKKLDTHTHTHRDQLESNKAYLLWVHTNSSCCFKGLVKLALVWLHCFYLQRHTAFFELGGWFYKECCFIYSQLIMLNCKQSVCFSSADNYPLVNISLKYLQHLVPEEKPLHQNECLREFWNSSVSLAHE